MKNILFLTLLLTMLALGTVNAQAANQYIRSGANGANNRTDSINAYTSLPASLVRGDTYYIASGTYGGRTFNTPASGTLVIRIKKSETAAHRAEPILAGRRPCLWIRATAARKPSGQVRFGSARPIGCSMGQCMERSRPSHHGTSPKSAYGFRIGSPITPPGGRVFQIYNTSATVTDITLSNIVATSANATGSGGSCSGQTYFIATNDSTRSVNNLRMSYLFADNYENVVWGTSPGPTHAGWVFERSISYHGYSDSNCHGEDLNNNYGNILDWAIRYNWFEARSSGTATITAGLNGQVGTYYIYGNVFKDQQAGNGVIACIWGSGTIYLYNNSFINSPLASGGPWLAAIAYDVLWLARPKIICCTLCTRLWEVASI